MKFEIVIILFFAVLVVISAVGAYLLTTLICWIAEKQESRNRKQKQWKH